MSITVLVADDSELMRRAIRSALEEESRLKLVGEASTLAEALRSIESLKPHVLVFDLNLVRHSDMTPAMVKSRLANAACTVAVSFANDREAIDQAASYGAVALLDKMNLYNQLIPTILRCGPN